MKQNRNKFRRFLSALLIAILMLTASVPAMAATKGDILRVNENYARLRAKPKAGSEILTKLKKGTKVIYLGNYRGWIKLELANGKQGYMYKSFLSSYATAKVGKVYRSRLNGKLAVRSKPNSKAKVRFSVKNTSTMVLLERKGTWGLIRVVSSGKVGYVNLKYLKSAKK